MNFFEELTCVKYRRSETPKFYRVSSMGSTASSATSCSSDCDDRSLSSSLEPSPLPSPFVLDRTLSQGFSFDDCLADGQLSSDSDSCFRRKETAWAPVPHFDARRSSNNNAIITDDSKGICPLEREKTRQGFGGRNEYHFSSGSAPQSRGDIKLDQNQNIATLSVSPFSTNSCRDGVGRPRKLPKSFDIYEI